MDKTPSVFGQSRHNLQANGAWVASTILLTTKNRRRRIPTNQGRNRPMSEASKRYQERHKRLGICVRCNRKATTGFVTCRVCLERTRKWRMERHPLFCLECRKLIKPEERWRGNRFHKLCGQKRRARYPQQHRATALAYRKRHRKLGLCLQCPRKVFKGGYCRKHYRMERERKR